MDTRREKAVAIAHDFLQSGVELPFSSDIGPSLLTLSSQPIENIEVEKLVQLIQVDPGLTTKILQLANSVYFSGLKKIVSLRRAIIQIGLEEAINFIHVVYYRKSLPEFPEIEGFTDNDYWNHSWACALANKMLGHPAVSPGILPGELYIAGLLHGLGKLILALQRPDEFVQCLELSKDFHQPVPEAQIDIIGTTDADIAYELLKTWQLPENVCNAIKYYQNPDEAEEQYQEIAGLTQFAYYLANTSGLGNMMDEFCFDINQTWISAHPTLSLSDEKLRTHISSKIYTALESKSSFLLEVTSANDASESPGPATLQNHQNPQGANNTGNSGKQERLTRIFAWIRTLFS